MSPGFSEMEQGGSAACLHTQQVAFAAHPHTHQFLMCGALYSQKLVVFELFQDS